MLTSIIYGYAEEGEKNIRHRALGEITDPEGCDA